MLDAPQEDDVRIRVDEMELLIDPVTRTYTERLVADFVETPNGGQFIFIEREEQQ